jgi:hypothetical protein
MGIIGLVLVFVIASLLMATSLWLAMKITKVEGTFLAMLIIGAVTTLLGFLPILGSILALVALYFMLHKWTSAEFWPDSIILVIVAWFVRFAALRFLALLLA